MATSFDDIFNVSPSRIVVPVGATLAIFVDGVAGEKALTLKYYTGGTLEILEAVGGSTLTPAALATASGTGYLMSANEALTFDGPTRLYLSCTGATTTIMAIKAKGAGG